MSLNTVSNTVFMALIRQTSPHTLGINSTNHIMRMVLLALLPALFAQTLFFGIGPLVQVALCSLVALATEVIMLLLRKKPLTFYVQDGSALVTAWLLAMAIPATAPWWIAAIGVSFAITLGKHVYGGMGHNLFNPAMLGYVLLLTSFPLEMSTWLTPHNLNLPSPNTLQILSAIFNSHTVDGWSMATPLELVRDNHDKSIKDLWFSEPRLWSVASRDAVVISIAYIMGGCFLIWKKIINWQAPLGMLVGTLVMGLCFWNGAGPTSNGSPLFHLFSGATMMGAFFIITDPVTGATSNTGRLLFGFGVGIITLVIRIWGGYPDGIAFATLLMNMAAPALDYWTQPRTYGHPKANQGMVNRNEY